MPRHGETGELVTYDRQSANTLVRCVSRERWCEKCGQWVSGTGIVTLVLGSVGCPKCQTLWENRPEPAALPECPF